METLENIELLGYEEMGKGNIVAKFRYGFRRNFNDDGSFVLNKGSLKIRLDNLKKAKRPHDVTFMAYNNFPKKI